MPLSWAAPIRHDPRTAHLAAMVTVRITGLGPPGDARHLPLETLLDARDAVRRVLEAVGGVPRFIGDGVDPQVTHQGMSAECVVLIYELPWDGLSAARDQLAEFLVGAPVESLWWLVAGDPALRITPARRD